MEAGIGEEKEKSLVVLPQEAMLLGAADPAYFARYFFSRAIKQGTPEFHYAMWAALTDPQWRHVAIKVFRGGAKTTLLRIFTAMRIAYGISRTILYVSEAQSHSAKSITWLKKAVEYNYPFANTFGLRPGAKWTEEDIEILHGPLGHSVRVIAHGITGQNRGINIDDYRPDLIVVDDPCDEENTATKEQRDKTSSLFFGALEKSLAPRSESADAKMVLLQTPLHREDLIESCMKDPQWSSLAFGCFDERGNSRWPQRFPTEELLMDKEAHIRRNQLSLWMREMECSVISPEKRAFKEEWVRYWDTIPEEMLVYMAIDPAPPLSDVARAKGYDRDWQAMVVVGRYKGKAFVLEVSLAKDQNPEQTAMEFFRLATKWRPRAIGVESIAYQRVLAVFLRQKMAQTGKYYFIQELTDRRKKDDRIRQALVGIASAGQLYFHRSHTELVQQFLDYPETSHDDALDALAMAMDLAGPARLTDLETEYRRIEEDERDIPALTSWRSCP